MSDVEDFFVPGKLYKTNSGLYDHDSQPNAQNSIFLEKDSIIMFVEKIKIENKPYQMHLVFLYKGKKCLFRDDFKNSFSYGINTGLIERISRYDI